MKETIEKTTGQLIIDTARNLFWKHGIRRITVEEICKEAGVSKMTFYRLYKNKNDIAEIVLNGIIEDSVLQYKNIMKQNVPFSQKIAEIIKLKQMASANISEEFLKDIIHGKTGLHKRIEEAQKISQAIFIKDLKAAQKKGLIRKDLKIEFIHYMLNSLNEKMADDSFISMFKDPQDAIMEATNFFFYGILTNENEAI